MLKLSSKQRIALFSGLMVLINILQGYFTNLSHDEAYYWMYSRFPDWAYFDHPPVTPLLIKLGYFLVPNELGVRLFFILLNGGTIYLLFLLNSKMNAALFAGLLASIFLVQFGFLAAPDVPLIFCSVLFLHLVKDYLIKESLQNIIGLCLVVPLILYTKYHGILLLSFTLIGAPFLLKRKSFYLIITASIILLIPQIIWQIKNDFPTIHYYLSERSGSGFFVENILNYLLGVFFVCGPIAGLLLIPISIRKKSIDPFDKILRSIFLGILLFFLSFSFRGRIEANWITITIIPSVLFTVHWMGEHPKGKHILRAILIPSIILFALIRIQLIYPFASFKGNRSFEYHGWKDLGNKINEQRNGLPLLANNYQLASKISFYTGALCASLNRGGRANQFDIWEIQEQHLGKEVMFVSHQKSYGTKLISDRFGKDVYLNYLPQFGPFYQSELIVEGMKAQYKISDKVGISIKLDQVNMSNGIDLSQYETTKIRYILNRNDSLITWGWGSRLQLDKVNLEAQYVWVDFPSEPGVYTLEFYLYHDHVVWYPNTREFSFELIP